MVQRIEDVGVVDVESDEYVDKEEKEEELVEVELPTRGKRRMITGPAPGDGVVKSKGKVVYDLEGGGVEKKKGAAGRKRKG